MAERDTNAPEIRLNELQGLNERSAVNATPEGEWESLEGLYPETVGLLARIPGKRLYRKLNSPIWQLHQTNDGSGNILVQTRDDLQVFTLDDLLGRAFAPTLTPPSSAATEEEFMSMAILVHQEANGVNGGILGVTANTFYTRKLTDILYNATSTVVSIDTGSDTFKLAAGTYRIDAEITNHIDGTSDVGICSYLHNFTNARAEHYKGGAGGSPPIMATVSRVQRTAGAAGEHDMLVTKLSAEFEVTGADQDFCIKQAMTSRQNETRSCGRASGVTAVVPGPGAAPVETYMIIKLLRV